MSVMNETKLALLDAWGMKMQECRRCGKTAEDNVIGFLNPYCLCTECAEQFEPTIIRELNLFCLGKQERLRIAQFMEYLKQKGWNRREISQIEVILFESPDTKYVTVRIPARVGLVDHLHVLEIAADILSTYEERDVGDVLSDILRIRKSAEEKG